MIHTYMYIYVYSYKIALKQIEIPNICKNVQNLVRNTAETPFFITFMVFLNTF